ncbi:MAG: hypothetical protein RIS79_2377 [Verrucomicrobiota bacterium]
MMHRSTFIRHDGTRLEVNDPLTTHATHQPLIRCGLHVRDVVMSGVHPQLRHIPGFNHPSLSAYLCPCRVSFTVEP